MFDNVITVFKFVSDLHFYVTGTQDENELILVTVLQALFDAISLLLRCAHYPSIRYPIHPITLLPPAPGLKPASLCRHRRSHARARASWGFGSVEAAVGLRVYGMGRLIRIALLTGAGLGRWRASERRRRW